MHNFGPGGFTFFADVREKTMRLSIVVGILHTTTAKQEDLLLLRDDQCGDALFVAHWTHVPMVSRRPTTLQ